MSLVIRTILSFLAVALSLQPMLAIGLDAIDNLRVTENNSVLDSRHYYTAVTNTLPMVIAARGGVVNWISDDLSADRYEQLPTLCTVENICWVRGQLFAATTSNQLFIRRDGVWELIPLPASTQNIILNANGYVVCRNGEFLAFDGVSSEPFRVHQFSGSLEPIDVAVSAVILPDLSLVVGTQNGKVIEFVRDAPILTRELDTLPVEYLFVDQSGDSPRSIVASTRQTSYTWANSGVPDSLRPAFLNDVSVFDKGYNVAFKTEIRVNDSLYYIAEVRAMNGANLGNVVVSRAMGQPIDSLRIIYQQIRDIGHLNFGVSNRYQCIQANPYGSIISLLPTSEGKLEWTELRPVQYGFQRYNQFYPHLVDADSRTVRFVSVPQYIDNDRSGIALQTIAMLTSDGRLTTDTIDRPECLNVDESAIAFLSDTSHPGRTLLIPRKGNVATTNDVFLTDSAATEGIAWNCSDRVYGFSAFGSGTNVIINGNSNVFVSNDFGDTWTDHPEFVPTIVSDVHVTESGGVVFITNLLDNCILTYSLDGGRTWQRDTIEGNYKRLVPFDSVSVGLIKDGPFNVSPLTIDLRTYNLTTGELIQRIDTTLVFNGNIRGYFHLDDLPYLVTEGAYGIVGLSADWRSVRADTSYTLRFAEHTDALDPVYGRNQQGEAIALIQAPLGYSYLIRSGRWSSIHELHDDFLHIAFLNTWPNPTSSILRARIGVPFEAERHGATLKIYSVTGSLCLDASNSLRSARFDGTVADVTVDVSRLATGTYLIVACAGGNSSCANLNIVR
jgi:hypothetical protein